MKNVPLTLAIFAIISAIAFAVGWTTGRWFSALTAILALLALVACLWIALFGWSASEMSIGEGASLKWFWLIAGFLPLSTLVVGFISGRMKA